MRRQPAGLLVTLMAAVMFMACAGDAANPELTEALPDTVGVDSAATDLNAPPTPFALLTPAEDADTQNQGASDAPPAAVVEPTPVPFDTSRPGAGKPVTLGRSSNPASVLHAQILQKLLIEFGYDATNPADHEHDAVAAYELLGAGELDVWADSRFPADAQYLNDALLPIDGGLVTGGAMQGYLVTKSWALANDVVTVNDLNFDPLLANQLDLDGDGIGDIVGCEASDPCAELIAGQISSARWTNLSLLDTDAVAGFTSFIARAQAGQPAIAYASTPSAAVGAARVGDLTIWLSVDPASSADPATDAVPLSSENCLQTDAGCRTGLPNSDISVTANAEWLRAN